MTHVSDQAGVFHTELGTTGPRIAFLHGLFGQGKNWTSIAKALSSQARILLIDLPNHGRSAWTEEFSYREMAAAVGGLLRATSADEPTTLVGHSMGGKVAMMLALQHRELVERLCVVDVSPVGYGGLRNFDDFVAGMRSLDLRTLKERTAADAALVEWVPDPTVRSFLLQNLRRVSHPGDGLRWHWQMNLELLGDHLAEIGDWPDEAYEPYPGPVLWLAGSESRYVQPKFGPAMRTLFPRTQLLTVKGAGHWVHSDRPDIFVAAIRQFVHR
jgi:esterase